MVDLEGKASGAKKATLPAVMSTYRRVFQTILALVAFTDPDHKFHHDFDNMDEYCLYNPESKACYSMVWMYSLEPPLYYMLNKAMRSKDKA